MCASSFNITLVALDSVTEKQRFLLSSLLMVSHVSNRSLTETLIVILHD
jgi:hypothetical protein